MDPATISSFEERLQSVVWTCPVDERDWDDFEEFLAGIAEQIQGRLRQWFDSLVASVQERDGDMLALDAAKGLRLLAEATLEDPGLVAVGNSSGRRVLVGKQSDSLSVLKGCGPKTAALLAEHGIDRIEDLALLLPRGYEDFRRVFRPSQVAEGMTAAVQGRLDKVVWAGPRSRRHLEAHLVDEEGGKIVCLWFRVPRGMVSRLQSANELTAAGKIYRFRNRLQMAHPRMLKDAGPRFLPRYPRIAGLGNQRLWNLCRQAAHLCPDDGIPEWVVEELALPSFRDALALVHDPLLEGTAADMDLLVQGRHPAQERLRFTEIFMGQVQLALRRERLSRRPARPYPVLDEDDLDRHLPFPPTRAQRRVIGEIAEDMASPRAMQRLLQGDVGSGKTMVAFAASLQVLEQGHKVALMAPTEILAEQHAQVLAGWIGEEYPVVRLTASMPAASRRTVEVLCAASGPLVAVGTHALLSLDIRDLGLVIVDEQHRFGVAQRHRLRARGTGDREPHLLLMTATPIPRTLALTMHGDLDLSVIDEMPEGRLRVDTHLYEVATRRAGWAHFFELVGRGLQAFVVCPLVSESDKIGLASAEQVAERLGHRLDSVGLLHGRLSAQEKARVVEAFRQGDFQVLVTTTVVEVGVDIPSAAVMTVVDAERFGLAQLHQLRGRVGRGGVAEAHCLLFAGESADDRSLERLSVLVETSDGFEIAERDLAIRGPGQLTGTRQAGTDSCLFGPGLSDMISKAQVQARRLVARDPELVLPEHQRLAELLAAQSAVVFGAEAG